MVLTKKLVATIVSSLSFMATALLPFVLWYVLQHNNYLQASIALALVLALRLIAGLCRGSIGRDLLWTTLIGFILCLICALFKDSLGSSFLLLYPVIINVSLLILFGLSLRGEVTLVERFAQLRVKKEEQTPFFKKYCRQVTQAWCCFFVINGTLALITVVIQNHKLWALYNGCIAYVLIGLMFMVEFLVRRVVMRRAPK